MDTLNITNGDIILEFIYLVSALFFVVGLKLLSSPDSARRGNLWAATGMIMAMIATMVLHRNGQGDGIKGANLVIILAAIAFGGVIGAVVARRIKMTAMPQLVSFFNATGGAASALVALIEFSNPENQISPGDPAWPDHRKYRVQRQYDRLWEVKRKHQGYIRQMDDLCQPADPGRCLFPPVLHSVWRNASRNTADPGLYPAGSGTGLWSKFCDAHWRGRYAGGDLPAE